MSSPPKTWPTLLVGFFRASRQVPSRHTWHRYGMPFYNLLSHFFNFDEPFLAYQLLPENGYFPMNRGCLVVVDDRWRPVLVADIRGDAWTEKAKTRLLADRHMRQHFDNMLADCPLPRFWGLSLLGHSLRVYTGDVATRTVEPAFTDHPGTVSALPKDLLEKAWDIDILSQEGYNKMVAITEEMKACNAALRASEPPSSEILHRMRNRIQLIKE